jgi:RNA polymerase sigma-70 factor (ECF subfamily)
MKPAQVLHPSNHLMASAIDILLRSGAVVDERPITDSAKGARRYAAREDERVLVARAQARDESAFAILVERYQTQAYTLALRLLRSSADAEEVAQDAFVRAWRALPAFRGDAAFSTWLYRILWRRAMDQRAALAGRAAREVKGADIEAASVVEDAGGLADNRFVERLLSALPEHQRVVVTLYYLHDRSVKEVASVLDMPEGTVKTHLHRARTTLRHAYLHGGEEDSR